MEQQTGSKLGKYDKAVFFHPASLTYMQSTSYEIPDWNQGCQEKTNNLRYVHNTALTAENEEELNILLIRVKKRVKAQE